MGPTPRKLRLLITTSMNEKEILDQEIVNYIFATNIPFHTVDHPQFIKIGNYNQGMYYPTGGW